MKAIATISILGVFLIFISCTSSLQPIYTEDDLIFDQTLVGAWTEPDQAETWELTYSGDMKYLLVHTDEKGAKGTFEAHLLRIAGSTFLDITPVGADLHQNEFYREHLIAIHSFVQIERSGEAFLVSHLEPRWLKVYLAKNPSAVRHTFIGDDVLFTDSPRKMQEFLTANITTRGAFSEPARLTRKVAK